MPSLLKAGGMLALTSALYLGGANVALAQLDADDIARLREQGQREGWTFTVRENSATRQPIEQLCGVRVPPDWRQRGRFDNLQPRRDLPIAFDWRGQGGCTPIKDQDGCGACWAFSIIGPVESNLLIADGVTVDLSEQWLVSCTGLGGCPGAWPGDAAEFLRCGGDADSCGHGGAVLEASFPYVAWDAPCGCPYTHPYCIYTWAFIGPQQGVPTDAQMKQAIMDHGPVSVCVRTNAAFQGYDGGVFNACVSGEIDHAVVLVGWDDSQGAGVWFLRNSWGTDWGEDPNGVSWDANGDGTQDHDGGYMRIEYGCSNIGYHGLYVGQVQNSAPSLSIGNVSPGTGTDTTSFRFEVIFRDPGGQAPILAVIDLQRDGGSLCGGPTWCQYVLTPREGSIVSGKRYEHGTTLPAGSYHYRFRFIPAAGGLLYWPNETGTSGPNVSVPGQLQVACTSVPSGPNAYHVGDMPVLQATVRDPSGNLLDADGVMASVTPPDNPATIPMVRTSLGQFQSSPNTNWRFGCDCYTFTFVAFDAQYSPGSCSLGFTPCPCPGYTPVTINPLTASPPTICAGGGPVMVNHAVNLDSRETVSIRAAAGARVRSLLDNQDRALGSWTDAWDGRDDAGEFVPSGAYTARVEAIHVDADHSMTNFALNGTGTCSVYEPRGIAVAPDGSIYVLDRLPSGPPWIKLLRFNPDLSCAAQFSLPAGGNPGQVNDACAMAVDNAGDVHILEDLWSRRITVWNGFNGQWVREYGRGLLGDPVNYPNLTPIYHDPSSGSMYTWANDYTGGGCKVFVFDAASGSLLRKIDPLPSDSSNVPCATGIAVDGDDNVWTVVQYQGTFVTSQSGVAVRTLTGDNHWSSGRILIRHGRIIYTSAGGNNIKVWDMRGNLLQTICTVGPSFTTTVHLTDRGGQYFYATGVLACPWWGTHWASRIRDFNSADERDAAIAVVPAIVTIVSPNGAENWVRGSSRRIDWTTCGSIDTATIRLWKGASEYGPGSPITISVANTGHYDWAIPLQLPDGSDYRVRIEDPAHPEINDLSDAPFSIVPYLTGDLNCDGTYGYMSFGDINPFVQYLSNQSAWQAAYPGCDPRVGDINGDGTYGYLSFGDINPFVALLTGG